MLPFLQQHGFEIDFAHRTFRWTSEAPGAAVVHVVIVGFSEGGQAKRKRLFDYPDISGDPKEVDASRINFYLVDAPDVAPGKRSAPWIAGLPTASKGSQPTDGGNLIVSPEQYAEVIADPIAAKYVKKFRQAVDMLYDRPRWCLWLKDAEPGDLRSSAVLRDRLAAVKQSRLESPTASVREQADTPSLFTQDRQPSGRYLALPEVSSSGRDYIPGAFFDSDVVAGNKLIVWPDAPLWLFAYLQSSAFTAWVKAYAGRLKSDISISPGLTYFTFPFADLDETGRGRLEAAGQAVLDAREAHPGSTLADLYDPLAMPPDLRTAHRKLDAEVDALYGLKAPTEGDRLRALLKRYEELSTADQLPMKAAKKGSKK